MSTIRGQEPLIPDDANQMPKEPGASTGANDDGLAGDSTQTEGATPQVPTTPLLSAENEEAEEDGETALYRTFADGVEKLLKENLPNDDEENEEVEDGGPPSTSTPKDKGKDKDKVREGEGSSSNTSPTETVQGDTGTDLSQELVEENLPNDEVEDGRPRSTSTPNAEDEDKVREGEGSSSNTSPTETVQGDTGTDLESGLGTRPNFPNTRKGLILLATGFSGLFGAATTSVLAKGSELAAVEANSSSKAASYDTAGTYLPIGIATPFLVAFIYGGYYIVKDIKEWMGYEWKKSSDE